MQTNDISLWPRLYVCGDPKTAFKFSPMEDAPSQDTSFGTQIAVNEDFTLFNSVAQFGDGYVGLYMQVRSNS